MDARRWRAVDCTDKRPDVIRRCDDCPDIAEY